MKKDKVNPGQIEPVVMARNLIWAQTTDPIVKAVIESGGDATDCVIALIDQKRELINRMMKLEQICPRKIKVGEQTYIWRCPDELVPEP